MICYPKEKKSYSGQAVFVALVLLLSVYYGFMHPVSAEITVTEDSTEGDIESDIIYTAFAEEEADTYAGKISVTKRISERELLNENGKKEYKYRLQKLDENGEPKQTQYKTIRFKSDDYQIDTEEYISVTAEFNNLKDGEYLVIEISGDSYDIKRASKISSNAVIENGSIKFTIDSSDLNQKSAYQGMAVFVGNKKQELLPDNQYIPENMSSSQIV